jgi:putative membrane-bound dehydrogenase-like protein
MFDSRKAGSFSFAAASLAGLVLPASIAAQPTSCPAFTYVKTNTVDPNWPDSTSNVWSYHQSMTLPLSPDSSKPCSRTPNGFSARLWASEEANRGGTRALMAMAWDERGRLWGVESSDYPNRVLSDPLPSGGGRDRVVILEDVNGDGVADVRKVFATGFNLLTGLVHTVDGLVVVGAPHVYLFKDQNGDDVADNPNGQILYTGFRRNDTHATLSNVTYGLDNWIYMTVGYSGSGSTVTNAGATQTFAGNWNQVIARFKTDGSSIQSVTTTMSGNTWGLGLSETGQIFASAANRDHSLHLVYTGSGVAKTPIYSGADRSYIPQSAINPATGGAWAHPRPVTRHVNINNAGFPATSNHSLYTARHFPPAYWDKTAFVCDGPHHLCHQFTLAPYKSTYRSFEDTANHNIIASTDPRFAPIQAHVGPDGSLWVLDWYNYVMNHNGICGKIACGVGAAQVTPVRDTSRARVYRVVYDARPLDAVLNLSNATEDQLLEAFSHPNLLWRLHAQRLLIKRGSNPGLIVKLTNLLNIRALNDAGETPRVIHALRTLQGFDVYAAAPAEWVPRLKGLLLHPSAGVRWNALDALPNDTASTSAILAQGRINDTVAQVRILALHRLSQLPGAKSGPMYTPYVTLDTYSQNRFNAVAGLTQSATMPVVPPLQSPASVRSAHPRFQREVGVFFRGGAFELLGLASDAAGTLTVRDLKGREMLSLPILEGRAAAPGRPLAQGVYLYHVAFAKGGFQAGRFSVASR